MLENIRIIVAIFAGAITAIVGILAIANYLSTWVQKRTRQQLDREQDEAFKRRLAKRRASKLN